MVPIILFLLKLLMIFNIFLYAIQQIHVFECRIDNFITFTSKLIKNNEISRHVHLSLQRPSIPTINITIIQNV